MTNKEIATKVAKKVVGLLAKKGIETECDYGYHPIEKILRYSWYVKKTKECGHTDCIFIDIPCGGFLAVLEDGKIMSGCNFMIVDGFSNILIEIGKDFDEIFNFKIYQHPWDEEDVCIIATWEQFSKVYSN